MVSTKLKMAALSPGCPSLVEPIEQRPSVSAQTSVPRMFVNMLEEKYLAAQSTANLIRQKNVPPYKRLPLARPSDKLTRYLAS